MTLYPRLYREVPRSDFQSLKGDYTAKPELRDTVFRHVGLTEDARDFIWTQSCGRVSGECNPHTRHTSYKKGKYVPPDDLALLLKQVMKTSRKESQLTASADLARRKLRRRVSSANAAGLMARLRGDWAGSSHGEAASEPVQAGLPPTEGARGAGAWRAAASRLWRAGFLPAPRAPSNDGQKNLPWPCLAAASLGLLLFGAWLKLREQEQ